MLKEIKENKSELRKHMSFGAVWALAVGSIIGWGCFIQGAEWTRQAGGPMALVIGFILGGLLMIVIGLCYAYLIPKLQVSGGEFAYAYYSFGRTHGFICGWMMLLGYITLAAMNATAIPVLTSYILPEFRFCYLYTLAGYDVYLSDIVISVLFLLFFAGLNCFNARKTGHIQLFMAILLCMTVALAVIGTVLSGKSNFENLKPLYGEGKSLFQGVLSILVVAPYCFVGFDTIPQVAEEYNFDNRRIKFLIVSALVVGAGIYIAMALVSDIVIPWRNLYSLRDAEGRSVSWITGQVLEISMGRIGTIFISIAVLMAIFTGINGFYLAGSRLLFSMGRAKFLPIVFGKVSNISQTPNNAILFMFVFCSICPFFGRNVLGWVIDACSVGTAVGYLYTCLSAFVIAKKKKESIIMKLLPILGAFISALILILLLLPITSAQMSSPSFIILFIWVIIGVLFSLYGQRKLKCTSEDETDILVLGKKKRELQL